MGRAGNAADAVAGRADVLEVDDHPGIRDLVRDVLTAAGYGVRAAGDGAGGAHAPGDAGSTPLAALRRRVAWTQRDLAGAAGVSVRTVGGLERGAGPRPRPWVARALAAALGVAPAAVAEFRDAQGPRVAGPAPAAPRFVCRRPGFAVWVYPDRIEVRQGAWLRRLTTVPLRAVRLVAVERRRGGRLRVTTGDGRVHDWPLGRRAEEARLVILGLLSPPPSATDRRGPDDRPSSDTSPPPPPVRLRSARRSRSQRPLSDHSR